MVFTKHCAQLLLLFLFFSFIAGCSSPEKDKESYLNSALNYIEKDENDAAIIELRNAIQIDAKYGEARYQLGLLYLEKGEAQKAFAELIRAADLDPDNLDASLKTAQFYLLSRKKEDSRKRINHILSKDPTHRDALALLANLELIEGEFDAAMSTLQKIGTEVESSDQLQNIKGRIHAARQEWVEAEESFVQAIALDEGKLANYQTLLRLYEEKKEKEKAKTILDKMVTKFPENVQPHLLLAGYYQSVGEKDLVEEQLQKVIEIAPDNPRFRLQLSDFHKRANNLKAALDVLVKARSEVTNKANITAALATLYFDRGDLEKTRSLLSELETEDPDNGGAKLLEARFLIRDGKVRDGMKILQALNTDYPAWADPFFYLGLAHFSLGDINLAEQAATKAIQKNKAESKYHAFLAQILQTQGAFSDSQKEAAIALRLNPKNLRSAIILSRSLIGEKKYEQAVKILKDMRKQVPGNVEILESLSLAALGVKDKKLGEDALTTLLEIDPGHNRAIDLYLGLKYLNDLNGAETFIRQQLEKAPQDFRLHLILGGLLTKLEKNDEALIALEQAKKLEPKSPRPYLATAKLQNRIGNISEALVNFQALLGQHPESLPAHMGIASISEAQGDTATAMEYYEKILQIKEDYVPAANNLAWLIASSQDGDLGRAMQLAMIAKQALPDDPHIADTLGWVHYKRQSYSLAMTQFRHALDNSPENPVIAYHLALAQVGSEKKEDAKTTLTALLAKDVAFAERKEAEELLVSLGGE